MIPKKIHYCWLSKEPFPDLVKKCIQSWKDTFPEYEFVLWDADRFDVNLIDYTKEAYAERKWAFVADYIRIYALYTEGGIYLDSDVFVKSTIEEFMVYDFVSAIEYHPNVINNESSLKLLDSDGRVKKAKNYVPGIGIQAAVMASVKGHPYLKELLDFYAERHFLKKNGTYNNDLIAPAIFAKIAENYGFLYKNEKQLLSNKMLILPSGVIAGMPEYEVSESRMIHSCAGSWRVKRNLFQKIKLKIHRLFRKYLL